MPKPFSHILLVGVVTYFSLSSPFLNGYLIWLICLWFSKRFQTTNHSSATSLMTPLTSARALHWPCTRSSKAQAAQRGLRFCISGFGIFWVLIGVHTFSLGECALFDFLRYDCAHFLFGWLCIMYIWVIAFHKYAIKTYRRLIILLQLIQ